MGNYINKLPDGTPLDALGKSDAIAKLPGAHEPNLCPPTFDKIPKDKVLVAVATSYTPRIDNQSKDKKFAYIHMTAQPDDEHSVPTFDAALICDTKYDFDRVMRAIKAGDKRPVRFFLVPRNEVRKMADQPLESELPNRK